MTKFLDANKAFAAKKFRLAVRLFREALKEDPENSFIYEGLARSLFRINAYDEAVISAKKALDLNSSLVLPHVVLAYTFYYQKNLNGFKYEATKAFEVDPNSTEALICYGTMLLTEKDLDGAISILSKALQVEPNNFAAHNNLANAYLLKENRKLCYEHIKKAFFISPSIKTGSRLVEAFNMSHTKLIGIILLALIAIALVLRSILILAFPLIYGLYGLWLSFRLLFLRQWKRGLASAAFQIFYLAVLYMVYILIRVSASR